MKREAPACPSGPLPLWLPPLRLLPLCLLLACLLCAAGAAPVMADATRHARLEAGQSFDARREAGDLRYEARLRLLPRGFFQLDESFAWKRQPPLRRASSGLWFQLDGGALLWLYNRYGLSRWCNVGEGSALYADMPLPGQRGPLSVVFRPAGADGGSLRLMGVLRREAGGLVFDESASGLVFSLDGPLPEAAEGREPPVFLEVEARLSGSRLTLERVLAARDTLPPGPEEGSRSLADVAGGAPWLLELPGGSRLSASFALSPAANAPGGDPAACRGRLDLAGKDLYLSLPVLAGERDVRLVLSGEDRAMLRALGREALTEELLSLRRWAAHGPLLVFHDGEGTPRCILTRRGGTAGR